MSKTKKKHPEDPYNEEDQEREDRLLRRLAIPMPNRSHFHSTEKKQYCREKKTTREYLDGED